MTDKPVKPETKCAKCGYTRADHALVNYCNPPLQTEPALICPTVLFEPVKQ